MNVYAYTRKSRHLGDPEDPNLLSAHLALLKRLAAADGVVIPPQNIRTEIGSGESISGRPVFAELLCEWERLPPGAGGSVYVTEPSRLSRGSHQERGRIQDALIRADLWVVSPERRYDPRNPSDELTWSLIQAVDHNEISRYRQRVALRRAEMTREGLVTTGTAPWGYAWIKSPGHVAGRKVPGHLEAHPERFPVLLVICREVLHTSINRLAIRYGIPYGILQDTLHNPVICGYPAKRYGSHHGTKPWTEPTCLLPPDQWVWPEAPGDYPAACTRAEWDVIQAVLHERHSRRLKTGPALDNGWCRRIVTFTGQPGPVRLWSVKLGAGLVPAYACPRPGQSPLYVEREPVHAAVLASLREACQPPLIEHLHVLARRPEPNPSAPPEPVRRQLAVERARFAVLKAQGALPGLDEEERLALHAAERECRQQIEKLKGELARLLRREEDLPDLAAVLPQLAELSEEFEGTWAELSGAERQEIATRLVKEIPVTVFPGKWGVRWQRTIGPPVLPDWLKKV